jgi:tetratricopeptide (TPR) repeat protein
VWWDSELLPHNSFATVIEDEIRAAKAVVVIWSKAATESQWVRAEAELGRSQRKLIQVVADQSPIPLPFNQYQAADLRHWHGDPADPQWRKVLASVSHFTSETSGLGAAAPSDGAHRNTDDSLWKRSPLRSRPAIGTTVVAVLALAAGGGALMWKSGHQPARGERIAIQPFETIGGTPRLRDIAAGLSNSLQDVLTQDQLQTLSAAEAETLKGDDVASRLKTLGVGLMFSGTVQAKDPNIAISMRLDDPVQHATLWTAQLSQPTDQSDQLQARVGALTVAVLNCSAQALAPTVRMTDPALQAFLHACELSETSVHGLAGTGAAEAMLNAMRQATREAPNFAAGHSMLAKHLAFVAVAEVIPDQPSLRIEADREAHRALELDPRDPDAFVAMGLLTPELDFAQREKLFRQALASDPAWPHANGFLGNVMTDVGRLDEALTLYQRAAAVNPQSVDWTVEVTAGLIRTGQTEEADRQLAQFAQLWPDDVEIWNDQLTSMIAQKRWSDALNVLDRAGNFGSANSTEWVTGWRALLTALQSRDAAARNSLRQKLLDSATANPQRAIVRLGMLGFVDDAFTVAQHYSPAASDSPRFLFQPDTAPLRRDPRFMALAARFKLIEYWRRTGRWPDFCSDPHLPYNCAVEAQKVAGR